jgi:hypothetical protein
VAEYNSITIVPENKAIKKNFIYKNWHNGDERREFGYTKVGEEKKKRIFDTDNSQYR